MFVFCVTQDKLVVIYFLFQQSVLLNRLVEKSMCQPRREEHVPTLLVFQTSPVCAS